jgi:hypothetical protein
MKRVFVILILLGAALSASSQVKTSQDSLIVESQDTVLLKSYASKYDPRRALLLAAVLPGLGQIYNKKYWKLPLVYGGLYATGYAINYYNELYRDYKLTLFMALEKGLDENEINDTLVPGMKTTVRGYRNAVNKAQRERDFMIIIMGLVYVLQIVDAHVDAHLKEFDLNPKLQVRLEPLIEQNSMTGRQTGVSLVFRL